MRTVRGHVPLAAVVLLALGALILRVGLSRRPGRAAPAAELLDRRYGADGRLIRIRDSTGPTQEWTRRPDNFLIQCGTPAHAERALAWTCQQMQALQLRLNPEKTQVVVDREGFDFLGFYHRRVPLRVRRKESYGVLRWPGRKARQRFRVRVRALVGPPGRLRKEREDCLRSLALYLEGWCGYYRHGKSTRVFRMLDQWVAERVARN